MLTNRIKIIKEAAKNLRKKKRLAKLEEIMPKAITLKMLNVVDVVDNGKTAILTGSSPILCYKRDCNYYIEKGLQKQPHSLCEFKYNILELQKKGYKHTLTI